MDNISELEGVLIAISSPGHEITKLEIASILGHLDAPLAIQSSSQNVELVYRLDSPVCSDIAGIGWHYPGFHCFRESYSDEPRDLWVISKFLHSGTHRSSRKEISKLMATWLPLARGIHQAKQVGMISLAIRSESEFWDLDLSFDEDSSLLMETPLRGGEIFEKEDHAVSLNRSLAFFEPVLGAGTKWVCRPGEFLPDLEVAASVCAKANFRDVITHVRIEEVDETALLRCIEEFVCCSDESLRFAMKIQATLKQLEKLNLPVRQNECIAYFGLEDCVVEENTRLNALNGVLEANCNVPLVRLRCYDHVVREFGLSVGSLEGKTRLFLTNWSHRNVIDSSELLDKAKLFGWSKYFKRSDFVFF